MAQGPITFIKQFFKRPSAQDLRKTAPPGTPDLDPQQVPLEGLFPLFVPAYFFEGGGWPGPYKLLRASGLAQTWAVEQPGQTMLYVNRHLAAYWSERQVDWRQRSMQNLAGKSRESFYTGSFAREGASGQETYALVFMHADGYGPSRLLLADRIRSIFPGGYLVALPEMSCGIALSAGALPEERAKIEELVDQCHVEGTRPLIPGLHEPSLLEASP